MIAVETGAETAGAFFDLDGTLLPAPSLERRFVGYLLGRGEISAAGAAGWLAEFARSFLHDFHNATAGNKRYLAGINQTTVNEWEKSLAPTCSCGDSLPFFEEALQRIAWHHAQRHRVILISGTLAPLARVVARRLAARVSVDIRVCATELEVAPESAQICSGEIAGEHLSGGAKLRAVEQFATHYGLELARSYAYGDGAADLQMLEAVGHAVVVNPTRRFARVTRKRGWQIYVWQKTLGEIPNAAARQLASQVARRTWRATC